MPQPMVRQLTARRLAEKAAPRAKKQTAPQAACPRRPIRSRISQATPPRPTTTAANPRRQLRGIGAYTGGGGGSGGSGAAGGCGAVSAGRSGLMEGRRVRVGGVREVPILTEKAGKVNPADSQKPLIARRRFSGDDGVPPTPEDRHARLAGEPFGLAARRPGAGAGGRFPPVGAAPGRR